MTWRTVGALASLVVAFALPAQQPTGAANPHGPNVGACAQCHSAKGWRPARISRAFAHAPSVFPLSGAHERTACTACHASLEFGKAPVACAECHRDVHKAEMGRDCAQCHTTRSFVDETNLRRTHELTRFPLRGAHATLECAACHPAASPGQSQYRRRPTACIGCHASAYRAAKAPDHQAAGFPQDCSQCHRVSTWSGGTFNHAATRFPLTDAHAAVSCDRCHADGRFKGRPTDCVACHQTDYTWTKTPPHAVSGFPTTCALCHSMKSWTRGVFNHDATAFALTGAHRAASCARCHADNVYRGKSTECRSCHQPQYAAAANPPHATLAFPTACLSCHTTTAWTGGAFDHSTTAFALTGAHRAGPCASCHANGQWRGIASTCANCHQAQYAAAVNPPHASAGYPTTCQQCHSTTAWQGASFDHSATAFALTGAHRAAQCNDCHADRVYKGKSTACVSCHQAAYAATTKPAHAASGIGTNCTQCHGTAGWAGSAFDHSVTSFALTGAHRAVACAGCHGDGVYKGKPSLCESCHRARYDATSTPAHAAAGFPTSCQSCHTTTAWVPSPFDHSATQFPLTGAHRASPCARCHGDNVYKGKNTACVSCHQPQYVASVRPPHATLAFPTVCATCHTTTAWTGATFDHAVTRFALTGAHRAVSCAGCHGDGIYRGKPLTCAGCHQARFDATTTPNHRSAAFPTTCEVCHSTTAWIPGTFNHANTLFPLTGAHTTQSCASCHGDGVYRGKSTLCVSCHQARYDATTNPNHRAAMFPTACASCHTTLRWTGATFNHDGSYFPIYSGKHKGRWSTCADCHTVSTNFSVFSCFSCHRQTDMDKEHKGRTGYRYDSALCYQCHPRGTS
ncbi:MAG: hypothetical protein HYV19_11685 [Gemmatimonadetes bacterium]|nr:hypothetical protein [Gemmatimonadota bacterium]